MSRRKHVIGFGLLLAAATTIPAYAQPVQLPTPQTMANDFPACTKKASDGDQELAKQKFIAARQDSEEGNYDSAIRRFKVAYDLDCSKPELLLIISSAFEKKGDKAAALAALEVYTQRAPKDAPDMPTTLTKIENLKKLVSTTPPPPTASSSAPPKDDTQEHTIWPWVVVGVGGAAVITGTILHLTQSYPEGCDPDAVSDEGAQGKCDVLPNEDREAQSTKDRIARDRDTAGQVRTLKYTGTGLIIGGALVVVGGLVWHFLEPTGSKSAGQNKTKRLFSPAIAPGYAGLSYGGTF